MQSEHPKPWEPQQPRPRTRGHPLDLTQHYWLPCGGAGHACGAACGGVCGDCVDRAACGCRGDGGCCCCAPCPWSHAGEPMSRVRRPRMRRPQRQHATACLRHCHCHSPLQLRSVLSLSPHHAAATRIAPTRCQSGARRRPWDRHAVTGRRKATTRPRARIRATPPTHSHPACQG